MGLLDCGGREIEVNDIVKICDESDLRDIQVQGWPNAELDSYYVVRRVDTSNGCIYTDQSDRGFRSYRFRKVAAAPVKSSVVAPIGGPIEITAHRCGACATIVDTSEIYGTFNYPRQEHHINLAVDASTFCGSCSRSIAEHIQYLKINHGPTRTGRT